MDHSVFTIQDTTDSGFSHTKLNSEKNSRNVKEITRPSRKSVLEKEPRPIYQNNSPLCRNSIQQVDLTSPQPTSPGHTSYRTWPSQYSGNVVQNKKIPSTPPSHYSGNIVQNQKIPSTPCSYIGHRMRPGEYSGIPVQNQKLSTSALPQKSNSNQSIATRITSRKQRTNGRSKQFVQNDNLTQDNCSSLNLNINQQKGRCNSRGGFTEIPKRKWFSF